VEAQSAVELVKIGNAKSLAAFISFQPDGSFSTVNEDQFLLPATDTMIATASALEAAIAATLPTYMVPTSYIPVARMPMTSSGKLDRRRLHDICSNFSEYQASLYRLARKSGREPVTQMEKILARLWETILAIGINSVGADDNFFRLGLCYFILFHAFF
jgi:hypothetical protein